MTAVEKRKSEILQLLAEGATDEHLFTELKQINDAVQMAKIQRAKQISDLVSSIRSIETASPLTDEERGLLAAAFIIPSVVTNTRKAGKSKNLKPKVTQKNGEVLIRLTTKSGKGVPATYNKGQSLPKYVPKGFKELYTTHGEAFVMRIADYYTAEGTQYFSTEQGQADLQALLKFIANGNLSPTLRNK